MDATAAVSNRSASESNVVSASPGADHRPCPLRDAGDDRARLYRNDNGLLWQGTRLRHEARAEQSAFLRSREDTVRVRCGAVTHDSLQQREDGRAPREIIHGTHPDRFAVQYEVREVEQHGQGRLQVDGRVQLYPHETVRSAIIRVDHVLVGLGHSGNPSTVRGENEDGHALGQRCGGHPAHRPGNCSRPLDLDDLKAGMVHVRYKRDGRSG